MNFAELVSLCESDNKKPLKYGDVYIVYDYNGKPLMMPVAKNKTFVYVDDQHYLHNDTGPATETLYNDKMRTVWYANHGKFHRLDGPAIITYRASGNILQASYYINGVNYTKEEFDEYTKGLDKDQLDMLGDLGQTFE